MQIVPKKHTLSFLPNTPAFLNNYAKESLSENDSDVCNAMSGNFPDSKVDLIFLNHLICLFSKMYH